METIARPVGLGRKALVVGTVLFALIALALVLPSLRVPPAESAPVLNDALSTCTTTNCAATPINGAQVMSSGFGVHSFSIEVVAGANECLRVDATSQTIDTELVVVAPNGTVWRNDDFGGSLLPEIRAVTPVAGIYTVQLGHFAGSNVNGTANLLYGRYNNGNPNCSGPTAPFAAAQGESIEK